MKIKLNIYFLILIGLIFILLKVFGLINWNWWIVTLPLWLIIAFPALAVLLIVIIYILKIMITLLEDIFHHF